VLIWVTRLASTSFALGIIATLIAGSAAMGANERHVNKGALVVSTESIGQPIGFKFLYRRVGETSRPLFGGRKIVNDSGSILEPDDDFTGRESGHVTVEYLEPGSYEIYSYDLFGSWGSMQTVYSPKSDFSIPFVIKAGEAVYIGDFAGVRIKIGDKTAGYFVLTDKHERDVEIARRHDPDLPPVTISVADPSKLGPVFRSAELSE
jgi:hypothetical protein